MTEENAKKIIERKERMMTIALILVGIGCLMFLLGMSNIIFSQIGGILFLTGACIGVIARENKKYKAAEEHSVENNNNVKSAVHDKSNESQTTEYLEDINYGFNFINRERNRKMCNDKMKDDAIKAIRDDIIQEITEKPSDKYEVGRLLWEDAANCFGKPWDSAGFYLNLQTKKLYVELSTYPYLMYVPTQEKVLHLSAKKFLGIAIRHDFRFQCFECEEDWNLLFDSELQSAVDKALEIVKKEQERMKAKNAIVIGDECFCRTPEMSFQEIVLELDLTYGKDIVELIRDETSYYIFYESISKLSPCRNAKYERDLTLPEDVWLEVVVDETMRNKDVSTRKSIVGGYDRMNISIKKSCQGDKPYEYTGRPINKYNELLYKLEGLAMYGSRRITDNHR